MPGLDVCCSKTCSNYGNPSKNGLCNACARVTVRGCSRIKPKDRPVQRFTLDQAVWQHSHSSCNGKTPAYEDFAEKNTALRENYCFGCGFRHLSSHWKMLPRSSSKHWPRWEEAFLPLVAEVSKSHPAVAALPSKARLCPRFAEYFACYFHRHLSSSDANDSAPHNAVDPLSSRAKHARARLASQRAAEIAKETMLDASPSASLQEQLIADVLTQATEAAQHLDKDTPELLVGLEEVRGVARKIPAKEPLKACLGFPWQGISYLQLH